MLLFNQSDTSVLRKTGKVRGSSLPLEYALAQIVAEVDTKLPSWSTYHPAKEWKGVTIEGDKDEVRINWTDVRSGGVLHLEYLPASVIEVTLTHYQWSNKHFSGTVDFTGLPDLLHRLCLHGNDFEGEMNLSHLPSHLSYLSVYNNRFHGYLDFSGLPPTLGYLDLASNSELDGVFDEELHQTLSIDISDTKIIKKKRASKK